METFSVNVVNQTAFDKLKDRYRCALFKFGDFKNSVEAFEDLQENVVYVGRGPFYQSIMDERTHRQVEAKVLEIEVGLAVKNSIGECCHLHMNYSFNNEVEIDGIVVHDGGEDVDNSVAYIIECGYNPDPKKINEVYKKVEKFYKYAKFDQHFRSVKTVVPVFGARLFSAVASQYCKDQKIWQVSPCGNGYSIIRNFSTHILRKLK